MRNKQSSTPESGRFEAVDPWQSEYLAVRRRNLPHLEAPGATYFVTFRCRSSADLSAQARDLVMATILDRDQASIDLDAAVIMPDHAHLIFRLIEPYELSQVLQRIKGGSARRINQVLKSKARFGVMRVLITLSGMLQNWRRNSNTSGRIRLSGVW